MQLEKCSNGRTITEGDKNKSDPCAKRLVFSETLNSSKAYETFMSWQQQEEIPSEVFWEVQQSFALPKEYEITAQSVSPHIIFPMVNCPLPNNTKSKRNTEKINLLIFFIIAKIKK